MITRSKNINTSTIEKHIVRAADLQKRREARIQPAQSNPPDEKPVYIMPHTLPPGWRMYIWMVAAVLKENPLRRWATWWLTIPFKIRSFIVAFTGGTVDQAERSVRWKHCSSCRMHEIRPVKTKKGIIEKHYCGDCGCPRWKLSELRYKNRLKKWYCPKKKHPTEYPGAWAQQYMKRNETTPIKPKNKGCSGNGG